MYLDRCVIDQNNNSIQEAVEKIKKCTLDSYPGKKVTWKIHESNNADMIYEWFLHEPYNDKPPENEIARVFLTKNGFHKIGFSRRFREMDNDEKEKWIKLFQESVSIVDRTEAENTPSSLSFLKTRSKSPKNKAFPSKDVKPCPLQGEIINGRYHAPSDIFSCQAYDFGLGSYRVQDGLLNVAACVAFYNRVGDFKKAEILFIPGLENRFKDQQIFRKAFEDFGIDILKTVDNAQGIEILAEEMIVNDAFFTVISIERMSVLRDPNGEHPSSTRGYLLFQDKDKLAILINQKVTPSGQKHDPSKHVENLKKDLLEYKKTFEFGPIPYEKIAGLTQS